MGGLGTLRPRWLEDLHAFLAARPTGCRVSAPMALEGKDELPRVLTLRDATMLVVSSVIGVGIFLTPGDVAKQFPSVGWFFFAWLLGGALALAGALANAELGAMFPKAGGNYVYLTAAYHPMAGFLVGWLSFFAIFAGTV